MKTLFTLMLRLYMSGGAVFEKFPAIPRMPKKHRGFHRGTQHQLGSSLSHSPRDAPPALSQRLTKTIPFFLSFAVIVILGIEIVHALFEVPPEVLNGVEVW
jgi:hypothetical protein